MLLSGTRVSEQSDTWKDNLVPNVCPECLETAVVAQIARVLRFAQDETFIAMRIFLPLVLWILGGFGVRGGGFFRRWVSANLFHFLRHCPLQLVDAFPGHRRNGVSL
jgi:hypothetical protein